MIDYTSVEIDKGLYVEIEVSEVDKYYNGDSRRALAELSIGAFKHLSKTHISEMHSGGGRYLNDAGVAVYGVSYLKINL